MRLSDAIALGAMSIESVPNVRKHISGDGGCALGMAEYSLGLPRSASTSYVFVEDQPGFGWMRTNIDSPKMPCGCNWPLPGLQTAVMVIAHTFNDHVHGDKTWPLAKLVDWVRSVEPVEAAEEKKVDESARSLVAEG